MDDIKRVILSMLVARDLLNMRAVNKSYWDHVTNRKLNNPLTHEILDHQLKYLPQINSGKGIINLIYAHTTIMYDFRYTDQVIDLLKNITKLGLDIIPHNKKVYSISMFTQLTSLVIRHESKFVISDLIHLTNLETLFTSGVVIPNKILISLTKLKHLRLDKTNAKISNLTNLTFLVLNFDSVADCGLNQLTNLEYLRTYASIDLTDNDISSLTNLRNLVINHSHVGSNIYGTLTNLEYLSIFKSTIKNEDLLKLTNLKGLSIVHNNTATAETINQFPKLTSLYISKKCPNKTQINKTVKFLCSHAIDELICTKDDELGLSKPGKCYCV